VYYERVLRELNCRGVEYIVVGGIAVNLHGVPRATADLDLLLRMESSNFNGFLEAMKRLGFRPGIPLRLEEVTLENLRRWRREKNLKALSFKNPRVPYEEVDVVLDHPLDFEAVYRRIEFVRAGGILLPLVSLRDLMRLKEHSGRPQDLSDLEALRRVERMRRKGG